QQRQCLLRRDRHALAPRDLRDDAPVLIEASTWRTFGPRRAWLSGRAGGSCGPDVTTITCGSGRAHSTSFTALARWSRRSALAFRTGGPRRAPLPPLSLRSPPALGGGRAAPPPPTPPAPRPPPPRGAPRAPPPPRR